MNFTVKRNKPTVDGVYGILLDSLGNEVCVTLENAKLKIPAGTYVCERYISPHLGYEVWLLKDVPGREMIEIHKANLQSQLLGCVALGSYSSNDGIVESKKAFDKFMALTQSERTIALTIVDSAP